MLSESDPLPCAENVSNEKKILQNFMAFGVCRY
jgi:hypothetical protein